MESWNAMNEYNIRKPIICFILDQIVHGNDGTTKTSVHADELYWNTGCFDLELFAAFSKGVKVAQSSNSIHFLPYVKFVRYRN
jgi:hypothetical protein